MNHKDERIQDVQQQSQPYGGLNNNSSNSSSSSTSTSGSLKTTNTSSASPTVISIRSPTTTSSSTPIPVPFHIMKEREEALIRQQLSQPAPNANKKTRQDFDFIRTIGKGSYGKVKLVVEKETGKAYAAKILNKQLILKEKKAKYVNTEKTILDSLDHPNVIKLYYTFQDESNLYFILEYCPNLDLLEQLKRAGCFSLDVVKFYAAEILITLEYLHQRGIAHRDLKPENILLSKSMHIKLSDFGTAKDLGMDPLTRSGSFCGTAEYVCPELLVEKKAGKTADLWSYGCLIYQIVSGKLPFKGFNEYQTFQLIIKREFQFPPDFDKDAQDLVDRLLTLSPDQRPSFQEIKSHRFFNGVNWDNLNKMEPPLIVPIDPISPIPVVINNIGTDNNANDINYTYYDDDYESSQLPRIRSQSDTTLPALLQNVTLRERSMSHSPNPNQTVRSTPNTTLVNKPSPSNNLPTLATNPQNCRIFITPTDLLVEGKEKKKELKNEQQDLVWNRFLLPNNEIILAMAPLEKKTGLITKKRQLIITDTPRIFYLDPNKLIVKGEIPVDSTLSAESKSSKHFVITTKGRHKHFFDYNNNCQRWVEFINDLKILGVK